MARRKGNTVEPIEGRWRALFNQAESSRLRRGKTLAKQGGVQEITVRDKEITASVKAGGAHTGLCRVRIPAVDWWAAYFEDVAIWLSRRPDWLGALFANAWDEEFVQFISQTGLTFYPKEENLEALIAESHCSCSDWEPLCAHVIALMYSVVWNMELSPVSMFTYVGIQTEELFHRVKQLSALHAQELYGNKPEQTFPYGVGARWMEEERACLEKPIPVRSIQRQKIVPELHSDMWNQWKSTYMAWE